MSTLYRYADYLQQPIPENFPKTGYHREKVSPIQSGQRFPEFFLDRSDVIRDAGLLTQGASIHTLTSQPLVVVYYSIHWNGYADTLIEQLKALQPAIEAAGAKLLVVASEGRQAFENVNGQVPFDVAFDADKHIARKTGIYKKSDPIWGFVAGVNEDVPVPAVFVVTPSLQIRYAFADLYLEKQLQPADILAAIDNRVAISA
ncbi:redoxin domain-containing protein [Chitinophaga sp. Cy-1792]|uniref:redoxin domain-containing protein n=1 Tax=Chitinophaga sp. Cy-1792 TaxID=2608339 RepID=UPI00141F1F43|nr:redoxin domain-containing protein [Chitinophaga sp. Cy-1792]NIG52840.1 redoxin domain-containing protein [Chitinophaga sp. Cy-1792]